jgi:hypothetical protein
MNILEYKYSYLHFRNLESIKYVICHLFVLLSF